MFQTLAGNGGLCVMPGTPENPAVAGLLIGNCRPKPVTRHRAELHQKRTFADGLDPSTMASYHDRSAGFIITY